MKTAMQHFRDVQDEDLRTMLLSNLRKYPVNKLSSISVYNTLVDALQSFKWNKTPENYGYWESKSDEIRLKGLPTAKEEIKQPERYSSRLVNGMDVIDLVKHWNLDFNEGNILKYLLRNKGEDLSDMEKIADYANRQVKYLKSNV
ncbi:hypothetical protein Phi19:1_gp044 [Cellulophaga phage phi19:1]|uniref:Uncharacterized protein n=1 Tax=Cellulophaga phage phi19:1 TaxID=1327970 RepID=R9ZVW0_9CAUD|nr:hypothetical protein Phi19:1_gp044 [Cellulophaga phage phi19:1]AGO47334.1 hypothetical protein Phi19:1_gp044 [Cellulophaga phage phi19:1]